MGSRHIPEKMKRNHQLADSYIYVNVIICSFREQCRKQSPNFPNINDLKFKSISYFPHENMQKYWGSFGQLKYIS